MASSNRHWPSLFKSKPNHHHQWQHDLISNGCNRLPNNYSSNSHVSGGGGEERSPEPKPRWNPKPEQIRILEAIFNSGMVNPPRDEIRKIRAQLQEYGQVGDANVFYWFQNRKSRSKNKQRHLHNHHHHHHHSTKHTSSSGVAAATAPSPSSSSSSEKSSSNAGAHAAASVNQANYFPSHGGEFLETAAAYTQGFCFSELSSVVEAPTGPCTNLLLSEIIGHGGVEGSSKKDLEVGEKMKTQQPQMMMMMTSSGALTNNHSNVAPSSTTVTVPSTINLVQGVGESGGPRSMMVFINDVAFEVGVGPFNVREAFGDDVVLINSCGQPVLTNEWGVTLHSLQHELKLC